MDGWSECVVWIEQAGNYIIIRRSSLMITWCNRIGWFGNFVKKRIFDMTSRLHMGRHTSSYHFKIPFFFLLLLFQLYIFFN
jgi:hypothetical protein